MKKWKSCCSFLLHIFPLFCLSSPWWTVESFKEANLKEISVRIWRRFQCIKSSYLILDYIQDTDSKHFQFIVGRRLKVWFYDFMDFLVLFGLVESEALLQLSNLYEQNWRRLSGVIDSDIDTSSQLMNHASKSANPEKQPIRWCWILQSLIRAYSLNSFSFFLLSS